MGEKWIAVVGSPRRGKNTETLTDIIIEQLRKIEIEVKKHSLSNWNITSCNGCEYCIKTGKCRINDEVSDIIEELIDADGLILASPAYNYNVTAQMKAFIDRLFCLNYLSQKDENKLLSIKRAVIIAVCAGSKADSMGYTVKAMRKPVEELDIKVIDTIEYYNTKKQPVREGTNEIASICKKVIKSLTNDDLSAL